MSFVTPPSGLNEPEVSQRVRSGQVNVVTRKTGRSVGQIVRTNIFTRINAILAILFALVMVTGSWINGAFGLLIIANSSIGIIQEVRAKRTLDRLTVLGEARPRVIREGISKELAQDEIVLDDLIDLGAGDQLVVDGIVASSTGLSIDESLLTGESDPVMKQQGDKVLSGSFVSAGSGTFQATVIGEQSYAAQLTKAAGAFTLTDSELQKGINKILKVIGWLLIPAGLLTLWTQLWRTDAALNDAILAMVAALVPMVPEGLVLMTSIAFAVGVVRLGRRQALVNELTAIEALARVDTVCLDKTGTLTEGRMEVADIRPLSCDVATAEDVLRPMVQADPRPNDTMLAIADYVGSGSSWQVSDTMAFSSQRKWSGIYAPEEGTWVLGAPDILTADAEVTHQVEAASQEGMRVLLLATAKELTAELEGIEPRALVIVRQKVREDAADTLDFFAKEGVDIKIISGDNAVAVGAVSRQVGVTGAVLDARGMKASDVCAHTVFGRVTPGQKRDMVHELQRAGRNVAMTGDGVNDVLALKAADIGVSMGSGAPATRAVAGVVLLDNKFATLPHVVAEGRRVIGNIERVANLFLTKTIYSITLAMVLGIAGCAYPFQPIHVTMIGWFTIGIPAFVLSLGPNAERARPGFSRRVLTQAVPFGLLIGGFTLGFWLLHYPSELGGVEHRQVSTATLAVLLIMAMWVLAVVARPWEPWKIALISAGGAGYLAIFLVPALRRLLLLDVSNTPLMVAALGTGLIGAVAIEACRRLSGPTQTWLLHRLQSVRLRLAKD